MILQPRKVIIHKSVMSKIEQDAQKWTQKGLESGGYLLGRIHLPRLIFEITDFIDGGPKANRTPTSFTGDNENAARLKNNIKARDADIRLLGEYHLHPWDTNPEPSSGDLAQLRATKNGTRPWYIGLLAGENASNLCVFDLNIEGADSVKIPYQILEMPENAILNQKALLDRTSKIICDANLAHKTVLLIGLGSGGCVAAKYLGVTGIGRIILVDKDYLELPNIIRHEGNIADIGKPKIEVCMRAIEKHNPFTVVEGHELDVLQEKEKIAELIEGSDLIVAASGNAKVNSLINKISLNKQIPAVYGGIFEQAKGGYVLAVVPKTTACFNCLFDLFSQAYFVDKAAAGAYNIPEDELHAQQGLWMDISLPSLMMTKVGLKLLEGDLEFVRDHNLFLYKTPLIIQRMKITKREDCVACNFEGWIQKQQEEDKVHQTKNKEED